MKKLFFVFALAAAALLSCNSATEKKTDANDNKSDTSLPAAAPLTGDKIFTVNPAKASIKWLCAKKLVDWKHNGVVGLKYGEVAVTNGMLSGGTFSIDMTTIHSNDMEGNPKYEKLINHLKSDDFFDVKVYPRAKLEITSVMPIEGHTDHNASVFANLTIKDITHNINFPAKITVEEHQVIASAKFSIDRSKWNVRYGSETFFDNLGDGIINNNIDFEVNFVGEPK
jgi:polyisoprenoid-binding protein YceI